ncbi:MAG: GNAT family N-acetyltransferase, partial [Pseudomonadota bacterium]
YFFHSITRASSVGLVLEASREFPLPLAQRILSAPEFDADKTPEQTQVISRIEQWISEKKQSCVLLRADRGRGKSHCLGLLLKRLRDLGMLDIRVTAPSKAHAGRLMTVAGAHKDFIAPDQLILKKPAADLVIIDEAAMIPQSLLLQICDYYQTVIMATTTGGYEGTGHGFMLRFVERFTSNNLLQLSLEAPVRWCENDDLENWINLNLIMPATPDSGSGTGQSLQLEWLKPETNQASYETMTQVYRLLSSSHYRTRPGDLRMLMENPDLRLLVAHEGGVLIGALLLNLEGGFDPELCREVFFGRRRPRGHLLAQMLTAQAGIENFACFRGLRILRIAVAENSRRRGVATRMIQSAFDYAKERHFDYLGASFAMDPETLRFWHSNQFDPVHISFASGKSSGEHSLAVLKSVSTEVCPSLALMGARMEQQVAGWLTRFLVTLDDRQVVSLLRYLQPQVLLDRLEISEVEAFARGNKGFELCFSSLQKFVMREISRGNTDPDRLLIEKAVQNRDWNQVRNRVGSDGKKQLQTRLRQLVDELIKA